MQLPPKHACPGQTTPQVPQLLGSVSRFVQAPAQTVLPEAHTQEPLEQLAPDAHAFPQEPQLDASLVKLTQPIPLQKVFPLVQVQTPLVHAPCVPQKLPQEPQLLPSVLRMTQAAGEPHAV